MQLRLYFKRYKYVSYIHLAEWLGELPPEKHSNRKDRHAAVSALTKYLSMKEISNLCCG
jgi:hypothetical protein